MARLPHARSRACVPPLLLGALVAIAACNGDRVASPRASPLVAAKPTAANPYLGWTAPYNCWIKAKPPDGGAPNWFGLLFPVSDTACGVTWTVTTPIFGLDPLREWAMFFPWAPDPASTPYNTRWRVGGSGDVANGPVYFSFNGPVKGFAVQLNRVDLPGHSLIALNSAGDTVGIANSAGVPGTVEVLTVVSPGIARVVYNFPLGAPCDAAGCTIHDYVEIQAVYDADPPPPHTLCKIAEDPANPEYQRPFNDLTVRRALESMLGQTDTLGPMAGRREFHALVRKNLDGSYRVDPALMQMIDHCRYRFLSNTNDTTIVAVIHTHPFHNGEYPSCPGPTRNLPYDGAANDGGSDADWVSKEITNYLRRQAGMRPIPYFVIDLDIAYFMHPDALQNEKPNKRFHRQGGPGGCKWVI